MKETIGSWLRTQRLAAGLSLREAADQQGIDRGYLSKLENNKHNASFAILYRITMFYYAPPLELLEIFMRFRDWRTDDGLVMISQMTGSQSFSEGINVLLDQLSDQWRVGGPRS